MGEEREQEYLSKIDYGNTSLTGKTPFWINGDLSISAIEQVVILQKLYRNKLPFEVEDQRLVKDMILEEASKDFILRAKTGWTGKIALWVGWVETSTGAVFFATNIDTPNKGENMIDQK